MASVDMTIGPPVTDSMEEHILRCAKINVFWSAKAVKVDVASFLDQAPKLSPFGEATPFPVPKYYCEDFHYPVGQSHCGQATQPWNQYVHTPHDLDVHGCYMVLLLIQNKILEHAGAKHVSAQEEEYQFECLVCALEDWKIQFSVQVPNNSKLQSIAWVGLTELKYWSLFLELALPKLQDDMTTLFPTKRQRYRISKAREAAAMIAHIMRSLTQRYRIEFTKLPGFVCMGLGFAGNVLALVQRYCFEPEVLKLSRRDLMFVISMLLNLDMTSAKIYSDILHQKLSDLRLDMDNYLTNVSPPIVQSKIAIL
ncbi:hypothetical protein EDD86DRAFT_65800 [Gorgonomyces haynaldii]|nr:hypothetical protein EDD86DRAFT_65800 [Gorgonomyces haynaldii]